MVATYGTIVFATPLCSDITVSNADPSVVRVKGVVAPAGRPATVNRCTASAVASPAPQLTVVAATVLPPLVVPVAWRNEPVTSPRTNGSANVPAAVCVARSTVLVGAGYIEKLAGYGLPAGPLWMGL